MDGLDAALGPTTWGVPWKRQGPPPATVEQLAGLGNDLDHGPRAPDGKADRLPTSLCCESGQARASRAWPSHHSG